jgi:hypothetical protein
MEAVAFMGRGNKCTQNIWLEVFKRICNWEVGYEKMGG